MACVSLRDLTVASCNGSRATVCGRPSWQPQRRSAPSCLCSPKVDRSNCNRLRRSGSSFMTLGAFITFRNVSSRDIAGWQLPRFSPSWPYRRVLWRSGAESLRSLVLGRALPLSLSTVQDVINLSCRHPHHASSLSVASESARCSSCGNCGNLPCRASSRVLPCKTFDCQASSSSRTSSRDRFSRLLPLFESPCPSARVAAWSSPVEYD